MKYNEEKECHDHILLLYPGRPKHTTLEDLPIPSLQVRNVHCYRTTHLTIYPIILIDRMKALNSLGEISESENFKVRLINSGRGACDRRLTEIANSIP